MTTKSTAEHTPGAIVKSKRADKVVVGDSIWFGSSIRKVQEVREDGGRFSFILGPGKYDFCGWYNAEQKIPFSAGEAYATTARYILTTIDEWTDSERLGRGKNNLNVYITFAQYQAIKTILKENPPPFHGLIRAERDRLREENASLQEALEHVISEVSWFVKRKKNLAETVAGGNRVWANVLDEDLDIARAALARHAKAEGRS